MTAAVLTLALAAAAAAAAPTPQRIPAPGGEVVLASPGDVRAYEGFHYAAARRAGDYLYVSGVVVFPPAGAPFTAESFAAATRNAFDRIGALLKASGVDFSDVVMVNTFHDWSVAPFNGDRQAQFKAFSAVKDAFMPPPHPAWTAVGSSGLLVTGAAVEVQMIAYVQPAAGSAPRR